MALVITLDEGTPSDELRSLYAWLVEEDELRGAVHQVHASPGPDRLGPVLEALQVVVGPAAGVASAGLLAWLRTRVGKVRVTVRTATGEVLTLDATHVRDLDAEALRELGERLLAAGRMPGPALEDAAPDDAPDGAAGRAAGAMAVGTVDVSAVDPVEDTVARP